MGKFRRNLPRKGIVYNRPLLGYDRVEFTRHALDRMKERTVTREQIYLAIEAPDETGLPTQPGRHRVRRDFPGSGGLDVVYEFIASAVRVITVFWGSPEKDSPPQLVRIRKRPPSDKKRKKKQRRRKR